MPQLCKPTIRAINFRIAAAKRHQRIYSYYVPDNILPLEIFGIKNSSVKGLISITTILSILKEENNTLKNQIK